MIQLILNTEVCIAAQIQHLYEVICIDEIHTNAFVRQTKMHGQMPFKSIIYWTFVSYTWLCHGKALLPVEVEERGGGIILSTEKDLKWSVCVSLVAHHIS